MSERRPQHVARWPLTGPSPSEWDDDDFVECPPVLAWFVLVSVLLTIPGLVVIGAVFGP